MRVVRIDGVDCAFPGCDREAELDAETCERHRGLVSRVRPPAASSSGPSIEEPKPEAAPSASVGSRRGGVPARITDDELRALHVRYRAGESIAALGRSVAARFASEQSATQCIRFGWNRLGLPRDMPPAAPVRRRTGGMRRPEQQITVGQERVADVRERLALPEPAGPRSFQERLDDLERRVAALEAKEAS